MSRRLRWFVIGAAAFVAVAAVAVVVAVRSVDPDDLRALLADQVRAATGRTLTIGGPVEWQISLSPTVVMPRVAFANMEGGSRPDMATVERIEAQVDLLALVRGTVHVRRLLIEGADILLETDASGRANWAFADGGAMSGGAPPPLRVDEVLIEDAVLSWRDGAAKRDERFQLDRMRLEGDPTGPHELEIEGVFAGVAATAAGTVGAPDALLRGAPLPIDLELTVAGVTGTLAATATLVGSKLQLDGLKLAGLGSDLAGTLALDLSGRVGVTGDLKAGLVDLDAIRDALGAATAGDAGGGSSRSDGRVFPDMPLAGEPLRAVDATLSLAIGRIGGLGPELTDVSAPVVLEAGKLSVDPLAFVVEGSPMKGRLGLEALPQGIAVTLRLSGTKVDFGRLADALGREGMVEERGAVALDLQGRGATLRAVIASLDGETRVSMGKGRIANGYIELASGDLLRTLGAVGGSNGSTEVNCIVSRFAIEKGIATHEAFLFDTPGLTVGGTGDIDLREERLDLVFVPRSKRAGLAIETPIAVRGTLASPTVLPDPGALAEKIGTSVLLNVLNPLGPIGLLVPLVTGGSGDDGEACAKALSDARAAAGKKPESEGGIGGFIRGIFGGGQ